MTSDEYLNLPQIVLTGPEFVNYFNDFTPRRFRTNEAGGLVQTPLLVLCDEVVYDDPLTLDELKRKIGTIGHGWITGDMLRRIVIQSPVFLYTIFPTRSLGYFSPSGVDTFTELMCALQGVAGGVSVLHSHSRAEFNTDTSKLTTLLGQAALKEWMWRQRRIQYHVK